MKNQNILKTTLFLLSKFIFFTVATILWGSSLLLLIEIRKSGNFDFSEAILFIASISLVRLIYSFFFTQDFQNSTIPKSVILIFNCFIALLTFGFIYNVVPVFADMFHEFGAELPTATQLFIVIYPSLAIFPIIELVLLFLYRNHAYFAKSNVTLILSDAVLLTLNILVSLGIMSVYLPMFNMCGLV